jgi:hypothetical protein
MLILDHGSILGLERGTQTTTIELLNSTDHSNDARML